MNYLEVAGCKNSNLYDLEKFNSDPDFCRAAGGDTSEDYSSRRSRRRGTEEDTTEVRTFFKGFQ